LVVSVEQKDEYANWLKTLAWEWFATLTLRDGIGRRAADAKFRYWIEFLEEREGQKIRWFRVTEFGGESGHRHFHALIAGVRRTPTVIAELQWARLAGSAEIDEFDGERNGIGYLLKQLEDGDDLDFDASGLASGPRRL
jgi:hypothetical protein